MHKLISLFPSNPDPRCHVEPNRRTLEPTPSPTPFPPPSNDRIAWQGTNAPTAAPLCPGKVSGFKIVDLDGVKPPVELSDGMRISLSQQAERFTIEPIIEDDGTFNAVSFFVDGGHIHSESSPPFRMKGPVGEADNFYIEGTYTLSAKADTETSEDLCEYQITVGYDNNPGLCPGLVTKFALYDAMKQQVVPGYESLADGQILDLTTLPNYLTIIAYSNGRGGDGVKFWLNDDAAVYHEATGETMAIAGMNGDLVNEWQQLRTTGSYTIRAKMHDAHGNMEANECKITIHVDSDWDVCKHEITGFQLMNIDTNWIVPGYEHMAGHHALDLATLPPFLSLEAKKKDYWNGQVQFIWSSDKWDAEQKRTDEWAPFASNGDYWWDLYADERLSTPGVYTIKARAKVNGVWEDLSQACELKLTIFDSSFERGGIVPPDSILRIIDNDDGPCAPKLVEPITQGNIVYMDTPVKVVEVLPDDRVRFKVQNLIAEHTMDWITTSFVSGGQEVCDKVENVAFEAFGEHIYEATCHDGYAFADVFAYSTQFAPEQASAEMSVLPIECKNPFEGQVVRYTFVFSCNCDRIPEIPDEIIGGVPLEEMQCRGFHAATWGDPHIHTFDDFNYGKWATSR